MPKSKSAYSIPTKKQKSETYIFVVWVDNEAGVLAPLGCVYYPLSILPDWLQILAKGLPLVYLFEEARSILVNNTVNYNNIVTALALNLLYFLGSIIIFYLAFYGARKKGTLVNMGE